jgi:hypothetical protein
MGKNISLINEGTGTRITNADKTLVVENNDISRGITVDTVGLGVPSAGVGAGDPPSGGFVANFIRLIIRYFLSYNLIMVIKFYPST